jgi:hypothetical protein
MFGTNFKKDLMDISIKVKLPTELWNMIWKETFVPQTVMVQARQVSGRVRNMNGRHILDPREEAFEDMLECKVYELEKEFNQPLPPLLLGINQHNRNETLRHYKRILKYSIPEGVHFSFPDNKCIAKSFDPCIYFNFELDTLTYCPDPRSRSTLKIVTE